jgi:hypothetical protein
MDPKAYRNDDDPSIVYVVLPGGHFDALRVNGKWKHDPPITIGHLEDNYRLIDDPNEVDRLFKEARTSTVPAWRAACLLRQLSMLALDRDQRRPMAGRCPAIRHRRSVRLQGLRQARTDIRPDFHWGKSGQQRVSGQ